MRKKPLNPTEIAITVNDGVITLGIVDSYAKKLGGENASKNIADLKVVV